MNLVEKNSIEFCPLRATSNGLGILYIILGAVGRLRLVNFHPSPTLFDHLWRSQPSVCLSYYWWTRRRSSVLENMAGKPPVGASLTERYTGDFELSAYNLTDSPC